MPTMFELSHVIGVVFVYSSSLFSSDFFYTLSLLKSLPCRFPGTGICIYITFLTDRDRRRRRYKMSDVMYEMHVIITTRIIQQSFIYLYAINHNHQNTHSFSTILHLK